MYYWIYYVAFNIPWAIVPVGEEPPPPGFSRATYTPRKTRTTAYERLLTMGGTVLVYMSARRILKIFESIEMIATRSWEVRKLLAAFDEEEKKTK